MRDSAITTGPYTSATDTEDSDAETISGEVRQVVDPDQHSDYMTPSKLIDEDRDAMIVVQTEPLTWWQAIIVRIPLANALAPPYGEPVALAVDASMAPEEGDDVEVEVVADVVDVEERAGVVVRREVELLRAVDVDVDGGRSS